MSVLIFSLLLPAVRMSGSDRAGQQLFLAFCKAFQLAIGAWVRHHGKKPRPSEPHIFVANHTSFIDFFMLSSWHFCHATVAQVHGGLFGFIQRHALHLNGSLFFYRDESKDREKLAKRMRSHTEAWQNSSPLLIFPEGTCVNNEYTVLFHKGAFELGCAVCPAAIKYNKRLLDPYWNTREQSFTQHLLYLMTRWIMIVDVWWLPPTRLKTGETAIQFADRVKEQISSAAGLKNLSWNGYMKNYVRRQDQERLQRHSQMEYGAQLRQKLPRPAEQAGEKEKQTMVPPCTTRRRSSVVEDSLGTSLDLTLTDLRNEILIETPPSIPALASAPLGLRISSHKDRLARSWKHHSILRSLAENEDAAEAEEEEDEEEVRRPASADASPDKVAVEEDPLSASSISMGIDNEQE